MYKTKLYVVYRNPLKKKTQVGKRGKRKLYYANTSKENWNSAINFRESRLQNKENYQGRRVVSLPRTHINLHIYVLNRASKYMRQTLTELQEEIDKSTIIVRDFNTIY